MLQKFPLASANQRMDDRFQAFEAARMKSELAAEFMPVDCSILHCTGEGCIHQGCSLAGIEIVDHGIRIVHRDSSIGEELCRRRFSHSDGAGETDLQHQCASISAMMSARSAASTMGRRPNHCSNPGTAWCKSMPRPSTMGNPCSSACARIGVFKGT